MSNRYTLHLGREITLRSTRQELTYGGVLLGKPDANWHGQRLADLVERSQTGGRGAFLHLDGVDVGAVSADHPYGAPEALPPVVCEAHFHSFGAVVDPEKTFSHLTVIWFQATFANLLSFGGALDQLDWERHAADHDP